MTGLLWLTWRQHRAVVGCTAALVLLVVPAGLEPFDWLFVQVFGGLVAVFWGAPLIARELEERTHLVAWGQDVSPLTWLAAKVGVLAPLVVVLAVPLGLEQIGYGLLGFALGVVAGFVGRTVPAVALTLVVYVLVRIAFAGNAKSWLFQPSVLCGVAAAVLVPVAFLLLAWRSAPFRAGVG